VQFRGKSVRSIKPSAAALNYTAEIEPDLITNLFDSAREKRRQVRYDDLPVTLVDAILSAEDKRFFEHGGLISSASRARRADVRHSSQHYQGASTITMQLARTFSFQ
jgi:penicillin-binding protein 1B